MSYQAPTSIDELKKKYALAVRFFIKKENRKSAIQIDPEDFLQDILVKFMEEETLKKYDPGRGASFKTFLERVLYFFYITRIKEASRDALAARAVFSLKTGGREQSNQLEEEPPGADTGSKSKGAIAPESINELAQWAAPSSTGSAEKKDMNAALIHQLIGQVAPIEERLLLKLKLFLPSHAFTGEECAYLGKRLKIPPKKVAGEVLRMYEEKPGNDIGIRNSDIARLLPYAPGSISTLYKRLVSKNVQDPYMILEG